MPYIVYDETPRPFNGTIKINQMDPHKAYLKHYYNYLYLNFLARKSDDRAEAHQARKELTICERKLQFWARHPNWCATVIAPEIQRLKSQWQQP